MSKNNTVIGNIIPGSYLTRGNKKVYIACKADINGDRSKNYYPWIVEDGKRCWSVNEKGQHMPCYETEFDIVAKISDRE